MEHKVKKVIQIVTLVRETTDEEEIKEMERLAKHGGLTSLFFYPLRDAHYDEGFTSGELVLLDGENGEELARILSNLQQSVIKPFSKAKT